MTSEEYLIQRLENQIKWYDDKSNRNKKCYYLFKTLEIILSTIIPFVVAYANNNNYLKIVAGFMSIIVAIIASLLIVFKFHDKWIQYRATCENLRHDKYLFCTKSGIYNDNNNFNIFVQRIEFLISRENSDWTQISSSKAITTEIKHNENT